MTADELKAQIGTFVQFGDVLRVFIPGEWDDRIVDYLRAFYASDQVLTLIAEDLTRILPSFAVDDATTIMLPAKDGTEHAIGIGSIFIFMKLAKMIIALLKQGN